MCDSDGCLQVYTCAMYVDENAALAVLNSNNHAAEQSKTLNGMGDVLLHAPFRCWLRLTDLQCIVGCARLAPSRHGPCRHQL